MGLQLDPVARAGALGDEAGARRRGQDRPVGSLRGSFQAAIRGPLPYALQAHLEIGRYCPGRILQKVVRCPVLVEEEFHNDGACLGASNAVNHLGEDFSVEGKGAESLQVGIRDRDEFEG